MSEHHNAHDSQDQQNHDDCQDCKREHAENQKLITIYERLQQVDKRTNDVKQSIVMHQESVYKHAELIKGFEEKVDKAKSFKGEKDVGQFQSLGFSLLAEMIESKRKGEAEKENERLRLVLKNIYKDRNKLNPMPILQKPGQSLTLSTSTMFPQIQKPQQSWFQKTQVKKQSRVQSRKSFESTSMGKSFEISSTKSSFNTTKRKAFQKKDFEDLNLWLFEQRNEVLQKQLYEARIKDNSKGMAEQYANNARKITRYDGNSDYLTGKGKKTNYARKRGNSSDFGESFTKQIRNPETFRARISTMKAVQAEHTQNSSPFFSKRPKRGSVLPSISNK